MKIACIHTSNVSYYELKKLFADTIENELSMFLNFFKRKAEIFNKKKHFISNFLRKRFSKRLAYQHIRTKSTRTTIDGINLENLITRDLFCYNKGSEKKL